MTDLHRDAVPPRRELRRRGCGYGVVVRAEPPACPMCRGREWAEPRPRLAVA